MRWVILNRDGVINEGSAAHIKSPDEWIPIPGSLEAIAQLHQSGFRIAVFTDQAGIGRGIFGPEMLEHIHEKMRRQVAQAGGQIDAIFTCPHGPEDGCACRAPKPGLFERFARECQVNLRGIAVVSDSLRLLQAAESLGAEAILVETGQGQKTLRRNPNLDLQSFVNLHEAAQYIVFTQG